jgi:heme exporter protein C
MNKFWTWLNQLGSPPRFYAWSLRWIKVCAPLTLIIAAIGLYLGLFHAPADYLQGESYRIIYIHVPCAWMSLFCYGVMFVQAIGALVWRIKLCEILALSAAPVGAVFTLITLITGSLWGKPTWGTYWTWDARLTSELILLFIYFAILALNYAFVDRRQGARAACILILIGAVNLPIIHFSVTWWKTLHQGTTVSLMGNSHIDSSMLWPLLIMTLASKTYFLWSWLARARVSMLDNERTKDWAKAAVHA